LVVGTIQLLSEVSRIRCPMPIGICIRQDIW
jgi:hypothetical protein